MPTKLRVAIVGADGQLGFDLVRTFRDDFEVVEFTHADFDVTDRAKTQDAIIRAQPKFVFNTAAFHKVGECERDPEKSFKVNALGAYHIAKAAADAGAALVYISTDYVFDGVKKIFSEGDCPKPINVYGASKLAGEILTRVANLRHYIVRTSGLFGINQSKKGHNFVTLMLKLAKENKDVAVVDDQFCSPTYTLDLARKIKEMIIAKIPFGVYHVTNQSGISWFEFAKKIFELAGLSPKLQAVKTADHKESFRRPLSTILENTQLRLVGIIPLRLLSEALQSYLDELKN